ncbi:MAG TPA: MMPL family transporter [Burkholderiales bacterium]|nr:MMPL family transporter [Burkholderiales bacterium]
MSAIRSGRWWLAGTAIALACVVAALARITPIETDLLALLPPTERNPVAERAVRAMADAAGNRAVFLVGHATQARAAAAAFAAALEESRAFSRVQLEVPPSDPRALGQVHREFRFGLLSDRDRDLLSGGELDATQWLLRRLNEPLRLGLGGGIAQDPFGFFGNFLAALPYRHVKLELEDGMLIAREADGNAHREYVLVLGDLPGSAYDDAIQRAVVAAVAQGEQAAGRAAAGAEILRTGAVFFAEAGRASAERDVDLIGIGSIVGIVILMVLVFRSLRPMFLGLLTVAIALAVAVSATLLTQGKLHVLTLVFGASLIGEAIDYSIQYFGAYAAAGRQWEPRRGLAAVRPGLTLALATSVLGYGALMLLPFPAVREIALFALAGLAGAYLAVILLLPRVLNAPYRGDLSPLASRMGRFLDGWRARVGPRQALAVALGVVVLCVPGWLELRPDDDVRALSSRPEHLVQQEARIRALSGVEISTRFFLVEGDSAEAVLRAEEALAARLAPLVAKGELRGFQAVSSFVPSAARQEENRSLIRRLLPQDPEQLEAAFQSAGLRKGIGAELGTSYRDSQGRLLGLERWLEAAAATPFRHLWMGRTEAGFASVVVPLGTPSAAALAGAAIGLERVVLVDKAGSVSRLFAQYREAFAWGLAVALVVVLGVLSVRYGVRRGGAVLLPSVLGLGGALALAGYRDVPVTLFGMMGLMLVLGVGVNYAIFLVEGRLRIGPTGIAVLLCAATTMLSFGLLAFSGTPALAGFGAMLLPGVALAVLLAPLAFSLAPDGGRR